MDNTSDLRLLLESRHPLIVVRMKDEARFLDILSRIADSLGLPVWTWSMTRGLARLGMPPQYATVEARRALEFITHLSDPGVFVFADVHHALGDPGVLRRVKELAQASPPGQTLVLTGPRLEVAAELQGLAVPWALAPPDRRELEGMVRRTLDDLRDRDFPVDLDEEGVAALVEALRGLSMGEAQRVVHEAALRDGAVSGGDVDFARRAKAELLGAGGALELVDPGSEGLDAVGGMERLKEWLRLRARGTSPEARSFGIDPPRGILLTGVPGCGKSLLARSVAAAWRLPLVLLDPAALYGPYVGESEGRLRDALQALEAMAPVVVWVDELEKGFAAGGEGDGGVSRRVLGTFLRWLQDRPAGVFLVATCNDVASLPAELLRKGRFDEVFFVDLPDAADREEILRVHLSSRGRDPARFDLAALGERTEGFSGSEIEAAVVAALYRAFAEDRDVTTADVLEEVARSVPLSRARGEDVARLRAWAAERAVAA